MMFPTMAMTVWFATCVDIARCFSGTTRFQRRRSSLKYTTVLEHESVNEVDSESFSPAEDIHAVPEAPSNGSTMTSVGLNCIDGNKAWFKNSPDEDDESFVPPPIKTFSTDIPKTLIDATSLGDEINDQSKHVLSLRQRLSFKKHKASHPPPMEPFSTVLLKTLIAGPEDTEHAKTSSIGSVMTLDPLNFENDIKALIDIETPYYALKNEHSIKDDATGEKVGFVCTVRREMPVSRENGGVAFGEVGRHTAAAATVASAIMNPKKERFHYLASDYTCDVTQKLGVVAQELSKVKDYLVPGAFKSADPDELTIYCRCNEVTKRESNCDVYLETKDTTWHVKIKLHLVSDLLFKRKHCSNFEDEEPCSDQSCNPYLEENSKGSCIHDMRQYPEVVYDWTTLEAKLRTSSNEDCIGHFYNGCSRCVPHSTMLLHNGDLIGQAISSLTGRNIPYKTSRTKIQSDDYGIKMEQWECQPQNLNFANSHGLKLQVKTYLKNGEMGEPGSKYRVECLVEEEETNTVCYTALGTFALNLAGCYQF